MISNHEPAPGPACERQAEALAALADNALEPRARPPLDAHLAGCEACRDLLADLREIRALASTLEPIEPPARVWHDVRHRIAAPRHAPRPTTQWRHGWPLGAAALASAAAIAAFLLVIGPAGLTRPPAGDADPAARAAAAAIEAIERPHATAIRELEQRIGTGVPMPADARDVLTRNLALVDDAIAESRSAVTANPGAAIARERLQAGLAHKLTLLRTMAALELDGG